MIPLWNSGGGGSQVNKIDVALSTIASNELGGLDGAAMRSESLKFMQQCFWVQPVLPPSSVLTMIMIGGPGSIVTAWTLQL